jgi:hypothetical protein
VSLRAFVPIVTVAAGLAAWAVHSPAQPPQPEQLAPPAQPALRVQGVGGCAAAGCHNAPNLPGRPGTEYGTWVHDPHGRAFATLSSKLYRTMVAQLSTKGYKEDLCQKCHATPTADGSRLPDDLLADGIGCESCHGPAEKWRTTHYQKAWIARSEEEKALDGLFPTKNLTRRMEKCAECHVGNADKDVNHDLIAAGHPRLNFEFTAYHHLMVPRHWQEPYEKSNTPSDWEAKAWTTGQAVTAKAAAELTAARAKAAGQPNHPWPEFSEYGCFACHHDLKPKQDGDAGSTWRQHPRYADTPPGSPPWGTWVRPIPEALSRVAPSWGPPGGDPLAELAAVMSRPSPDPKDVRAKAEQSAGKLDAWRKQVQSAGPLDAAAVRKQLAALAADGVAHPAREWDDAAQNYLALAALYHSLNGLDPASATPSRRDLFLGLRAPLLFPPAGPGRQYNSPPEFTPNKYKQALQPFAAAFRTPEAP